MFLRLHRPTPPLDRFVELITYFEGYDPGHTKEKLLPDGAVEIIVDLTDAPKRMYDQNDHGRFRTFEKAWISGMRRDWIVIEAAPHSSMAVIRFRPGGAYPFLGFAVESIRDAVEPLDDVLTAMTSTLRDRILEAPTVELKMRAIERWLIERAHGRFETHPAVEYLSSRLFAPGGVRIRDLVEEVGYSQRHVLGLFRRWVGLTPKQYSSVRRFQQVLRSAIGALPPVDAYPHVGPIDHEPDWGELALSHGYCDQAHLIHEFRRYSGLTPTQYLAAYRGLENYLPLN